MWRGRNTNYCYVNESTCAHDPISSNHGPWDACASANLTYTLDTGGPPTLCVQRMTHTHCAVMAHFQSVDFPLSPETHARAPT